VLAALGTAEGEAVRVESSRGSLVLPGVGHDGLPAGTAFLAWNLPGAAAGELIDCSTPFTEVVVAPAASEGGEPGG
jgi:formylmethanofuran dehydrogenase subunit D